MFHTRASLFADDGLAEAAVEEEDAPMAPLKRSVPRPAMSAVASEGSDILCLCVSTQTAENCDQRATTAPPQNYTDTG